MELFTACTIKNFTHELLFLFQGTAAVVLAGVVAALKLISGTLSEHKFLFLGAGEVRLFSSISLFTIAYDGFSC